MITRTNYAKNIIANFIKKNELCIEEDNFEELNRYVLQCTDLGLALEAIGKLDEEYKEYIANIIQSYDLNLKVGYKKNKMQNNQKYKRLQKMKKNNKRKNRR